MSNLNPMRYIPPIPIPPGHTLAEILDELGMSQKELAERMGRPEKTISEIVQGKSRIKEDTAIQLSQVFGISPLFWLNLESSFRSALANEKFREKVGGEIQLARKFPYSEIANLGWVKPTRDKKERVIELLSFFGVTSLENIIKTQPIAYRMAPNKNASPESIAAWIRKGEMLGHEIETAPFNMNEFKKSLADLRKLTTLQPDKFIPKMINMCADHGVAVVFVPHLRKTFVNGATKWIGDKALVILSIRQRYEDIFWFSFFHECCHIIKHGRRDQHINFIEPTRSDNKEIEADIFAAQTLIPDPDYDEFINNHRISRISVCDFANRLGISPAILVGRLQHDGYIPHSHLNGLRKKFYWPDELD